MNYECILFFLLFPALGISQVQIGQDIDGEAAGDNSGSSISLSSDGSIVAIGARHNSETAKNSGHVRVYENLSGVWTQIGQDIDGVALGDMSGHSVSLSSDGSIVAIGSYGNTTVGSWGGHVRVFENVSGVWTQIGQDIVGTVNQSGYGGQSGFSVSLSSDGTIVAIGSPYWGSSSNPGHIRIYKNVLGAWTQMGGDIEGEVAGDCNGYSVSLSSDGKIVAIGAPQQGVGSGYVRIFEYISGVWTQIGQNIEGEAVGDWSGTRVSLSGDGTIVAIGAPQNIPTSSSKYGHVRVYENISGVWTQIGTDIDGQAPALSSGNSIALSTDGNTLVVGSLNLYHAKVYRNISGNWIQICTIGTKQGHDFGLALSADGNIGAIGASQSGSGKRGTVQIYDLSTVGIDKFVLENFNIYPNPATDVINICLENNLILQKVTLYNNLGQIVKESNQEIIDVSGLTKGLYFVEVETNQGKASKKVIVK